MDQAKETYRKKMEQFVANATAPPTSFELREKHQELVAELKVTTPGINTLQLESELRQVFDLFANNNKLQRQMSLLQSALGNSLFEETKKDLRTLAASLSCDK